MSGQLSEVIQIPELRDLHGPSELGTPTSLRYSVIAPIGRGGYGVVFKARDPETGMPVALKRVHIFDPNIGLPQSFFRERDCLNSFDHPNILCLNEIVQDPAQGAIYLVLEYCEFDLSGLIHRGRLSVPQVSAYFRQLLTAVSELHQQGIIHRDLKPANVFVTRNNTVKLGDFGLARSLNPNRCHPLTQDVVTPSYRAPELIAGAADYGTPVDIWSLGCLLYEMITTRRLFTPSTRTHIGQLDSIFKICGFPTDHTWPGFTGLPAGFLVIPATGPQPPLRDRLLGALPPEFAGFADLIEGMLRLDPAQRITIQEALEHPLLRGEFVLNDLAIEEVHAMDVTRERVQKNSLGLRNTDAIRPDRVLPVRILA
jgi:serine/threonine protein kinase